MLLLDTGAGTVFFASKYVTNEETDMGNLNDQVTYRDPGSLIGNHALQFIHHSFISIV